MCSYVVFVLNVTGADCDIHVWFTCTLGVERIFVFVCYVPALIWEVDGPVSGALLRAIWGLPQRGARHSTQTLGSAWRAPGILGVGSVDLHGPSVSQHFEAHRRVHFAPVRPPLTLYGERPGKWHTPEHVRRIVRNYRTNCRGAFVRRKC